jgi:hypothetical protein
MTDDALAHVRFVDFTEHPFVLLVDVHGNAELHGDGQVCKLRAAALLRVIANDLAAEHPLGACTPEPDAEPWERPAESLHSQFGTLDAERALWTDGTGHVWNLSIPWGDAFGRSWRWHGVVDPLSGAPMMRCEYRFEAQPLDLLRALYGPIAPLSGGAE